MYSSSLLDRQDSTMPLRHRGSSGYGTTTSNDGATRKQEDRWFSMAQFAADLERLLKKKRPHIAAQRRVRPVASTRCTRQASASMRTHNTRSPAGLSARTRASWACPCHHVRSEDPRVERTCRYDEVMMKVALAEGAKMQLIRGEAGAIGRPLAERICLP